MPAGQIARGTDAELEAEIAALEAKQVGEQDNPVRVVREATPSTIVHRRDEEDNNVPDVAPKEEAPEPADEGNYKKRYGDLRRHAQKKESELNNRVKELEERLNNIPESMPQNEEDVKKWVETNPLATAIIKKVALEEASKTVKGLGEQLTEINREKEQQKIFKAHPDFDDIVASDEFQDWAETQPEFIQDKIFENENAKDVIWAISLYKQVSAKEPSAASGAAGAIPRKSSAAPSTKKEAKFTESQVSSSTIQWYEKNQEAIEAAIRSGEFVYDISGAAR